jgi:hypothetical protein
MAKSTKQVGAQKVQTCPKCGKEYILLFRDKYVYQYLWDSLHEYEQRFLTTAGAVEIDKTRHKRHRCGK